MSRLALFVIPEAGFLHSVRNGWKNELSGIYAKDISASGMDPGYASLAK